MQYYILPPQLYLTDYYILTAFYILILFTIKLCSLKQCVFKCLLNAMHISTICSTINSVLFKPRLINMSL